MHEARYYRAGETVHCALCPHACKIPEGRTGICRVRKNVDGRLYSLVYGKAASVHVDPVEKKPLYHFLPGSKSFSVGTVGCNMGCLHCQNFSISQSEKVHGEDLSPQDVVDMALRHNCQSISYTYNEPTVFFEYAADCARIARQKGLKNVLVTNGYITPEPAREFLKIMDAANVDLKAFDDGFYREVCKARLQPVLDTLKLYRKGGMWLEVTNLVIDGKNDDMKKIDDMCRWITKELGKDVPLHFSAAFPMHRMQEIAPTPVETLNKAHDIAKKHLDFVYIGNTGMPSDTNCAGCGRTVVERSGYSVRSNLEGHRCVCGRILPGVWMK
jgi:pyruvate formate lyase activating enzyme